MSVRCEIVTVLNEEIVDREEIEVTEACVLHPDFPFNDEFPRVVHSNQYVEVKV